MAQDHLRECIKTAIRFLFMESFEVPVLAMFYKEHLGELLSLRLGCEPNLLPVCMLPVLICTTVSVT